MAYSIWKFALRPEAEQQVEMPKGTLVLSVEEQLGNIVLYALVDVSSEKEVRTVWIFGTGHRVFDRAAHAQFIGTVKMENGQLMFHVFCELKEAV